MFRCVITSIRTQQRNAYYRKEGEKVWKGERERRKRGERWNQKRYSAAFRSDIFPGRLMLMNFSLGLIEHVFIKLLFPPQASSSHGIWTYSSPTSFSMVWRCPNQMFWNRSRTNYPDIATPTSLISWRWVLRNKRIHLLLHLENVKINFTPKRPWSPKGE